MVLKIWQLLDDDELEVFRNYKVAFKKAEFLVGRALTKLLLSKCLEIEPEKIHLIKNNYGKLYLRDYLKYKNGEFIQFNIAHSHNIVACAFALTNEVGIDIEKVQGPILDIVERFFSVGEKEYITKCELTQRNMMAYKIWTLKESFIKAKGVGLSIALDSFDVTQLDKEVFFKSFVLKEEYYLSIAINNPYKCNFKIRMMDIGDLKDIEEKNVL